MNNKSRRIFFALLGIGCGAASAAPGSTDVEGAREWEFRVYLGESEIGSHKFTLTKFGGDHEVRSDAEFNVEFLFFNAYEYRHRNFERWDENCLEAIESETIDNGDRYSVAGSAREQAFLVSSVVDDAENRSRLPGCVMTFAYWNPDFLEQQRLLNTQTGEYVDVATELVGEDVVDVRGEPVPSYRYRLTGEDLEIELWYSRDREWLALESVTESGRRLRYELI